MGHTDKLGNHWISVRGKLVLEHRHIMEQHLGRSLQPYERVLHINGDLGDNRFENLELRERRAGHIDNNTGHRMLFINGKPLAEHRYVLEQHLGRKLRTNEYVRHLNGDLTDNRLENLELKVKVSRDGLDANGYRTLHVKKGLFLAEQ